MPTCPPARKTSSPSRFKQCLVPQVVSEDFEAQLRSRVAKHTGNEQADCWEWQHEPFCSAVCSLKAGAGVPNLGFLGKGATAEVH